MIDALLIGATRFLVGGRADWAGIAPGPEQRIYFANHGSHLDTLVLWAALPPSLRETTHPVAAADYWNGDPIRRMLANDVLGAVLVDRTGAGAARDRLAAVEDALARGHSLILFPEGTRGSERLPAAFKPGLYHLAERHPAAALVPVYLRNLSRAFPRGAYLPVPLACTARFGAPLARVVGERKDAFLARARDAVVALAEGDA